MSEKKVLFFKGLAQNILIWEKWVLGDASDQGQLDDLGEGVRKVGAEKEKFWKIPLRCQGTQVNFRGKTVSGEAATQAQCALGGRERQVGKGPSAGR